MLIWAIVAVIWLTCSMVVNLAMRDEDVEPWMRWAATPVAPVLIVALVLFVAGWGVVDECRALLAWIRS